MAEFIADVGTGDETPTFDTAQAEKYLQDQQIHKLMGGLLQALVDNKPADPVDFLVTELTRMEQAESASNSLPDCGAHPDILCL